MVITSGRTDIDDYFRLSGVLSCKKLTHTPFLIFVERENVFEVKIIDNAEKLLEFPDETKVMGQWQGNWRSDFFQFTVGDVRKHKQKTEI